MRLETLVALGRIWARIFYRYEAHGIENIPAAGPCIIGCNHSGKLLGDMGVMLAIIPRRIPVIIAAEGMYRGLPTARKRAGAGESLGIRVLQTGARSAPTIGIRRGGDSPIAQNRAMLEALQQGQAVFLAVEGEVSWDGRPNPARSGAPWMALRSGAPFVPCGITGSYDIWPRWETNPRLTGKIIVRIGKPFYLAESIPELIDKRMLADAGERIMAEIAQLVG